MIRQSHDLSDSSSGDADCEVSIDFNNAFAAILMKKDENRMVAAPGNSFKRRFEPRNPNMIQDDASIEERPQFRESYTISPHKSKAAESEAPSIVNHHDIELVPVYTPCHESID